MFKNGMRPIHPGEILLEDYIVGPANFDLANSTQRDGEPMVDGC